MAHRVIFDGDPDPVRLFDELYFQGARDPQGLPLGDVAGHARRRYTACYGALCLTRMLVDISRIDAPAGLMVTGARFQDKQTSREFPAAHAIPCDLRLALPGHPPPGVRLYDLLRDPFNRTWTRREIFGQTDRVHRLANLADRRCEAGADGMAMALAAACDAAIRDGLRAKVVSPAGARGATVAASVASLFETSLAPAFIAAARARLGALETEFTDHERGQLARAPIVDRFGRPIMARPVDTRIGSPDAEARAAARIAMRQILQIYADPDCVDRAALGAIAGKIDALRLNEQRF